MGGVTTFVKRDADAPAHFFEAEAAGLAWLGAAEAAGGARTAAVLEVDDAGITLERIDEVAPSAEAAREFGRALAVTHDAGAPAFGAPPEGYDGPLYIGARAMPSASETSWGAFYTRHRVEPFLDVAVAAGNLNPHEAELVRFACEAIAEGALDDGEGPARIHGDLWNGNLLWSADGAVLIDPAAHGGHRETDLAMLALFGAPFLDEIMAGYQSAHRLRPGWQGRLKAHQLHPLAVHAAGHGRSYGIALADAAADTLDLVR